MWSLFSTKKKERKSKYEGIHVYGKYIKGRGIEFVYTFDGDVSGLVETSFIKTTTKVKKIPLKVKLKQKLCYGYGYVYTHR